MVGYCSPEPPAGPHLNSTDLPQDQLLPSLLHWLWVEESWDLQRGAGQSGSPCCLLKPSP